MRAVLAGLALLAAAAAAAEAPPQGRQMVGHMGSRPALLVLNGSQRADGAWRLAGEYIVLPTLVRRYLEGERSPELGITTLKEGDTPILFGRPEIGKLEGTWRGGVFKGTRYGPGGQVRERFEFDERFPSMAGYSDDVRCRASDRSYASTLAYSVQAGRLQAFEWRSSGCELPSLRQEPFDQGLRFASGPCKVTLRDLGDYVEVAAEGCEPACKAGGRLAPLLVGKHDGCRLLRPAPR